MFELVSEKSETGSTSSLAGGPGVLLSPEDVFFSNSKETRPQTRGNHAAKSVFRRISKQKQCTSIRGRSPAYTRHLFGGTVQNGSALLYRSCLFGNNRLTVAPDLTLPKKKQQQQPLLRSNKNDRCMYSICCMVNQSIRSFLPLDVVTLRHRQQRRWSTNSFEFDSK